MTSELRPAAVEQIDREAAASGYYAWCSGNPVIPNRMVAGTADDHSMVQAFARHRHQVRAELVREIAAWLRKGEKPFSDCDCAAHLLETGEWKL